MYTNKDPDFCSVRDKLMVAETFKVLNLETTAQQEQITLSLCKSEQFRNEYLQLNCLDNNNHIVERLQEELQNLRNQDFGNLTNEERQQIYNRIVNLQRETKTLNVKIFVNKTVASESGFVRSLANVAGFDFGAFHVGLDIDGVILEWGRGPGGQSLVVPHLDIKNCLVYARINFDTIFADNLFDELNHSVSHPIEFSTHLFRVIANMIEKLETYGQFSNDQLDRLSKKCVHYNTACNYSFMTRHSQVFVRDVLESLHMQFNPEGEFKKFVDRITQKANADFIFKEVTFNSRSDLEIYADLHWNTLNAWDQRLLVCYSDLMAHHYQQTSDVNWGPINEQKWNERITNLGAI